MIKKLIKTIIRQLSANKFTTLNHMELSRKAFLNNYSFFQKINPKFSIIPVLKSNAYGHGIIQYSKILNSVDCKLIAVDSYYEAEKIRDTTNHKILVLGYIKPENFKLLDTNKCSFVIQNINCLKALGLLNKRINIHIELNTGMNRLGLNQHELDDYLSRLKQYPKLQIEGVMTHLADADNNHSSLFTNSQVKMFDSLVKKIIDEGFSPKYIHIAQTAGCLTAQSKYANAARIGIGLFGINPFSESNDKPHIFDQLVPVMELKSTIIKIINLQSGDKVSYNGIFVANKPMRIGILPLGYYEGVPRELSNCGFATSGKFILPIIGRVCMNHTIIDLADSRLQEGDEITIISNKPSQINSIAQICKNNKLFSYQLMSNITENIRRIIVD